MTLTTLPGALYRGCVVMDTPRDPLERRRALLTAALGFARLHAAPSSPALHTLRRWLDSWPGIGAVLVGMTAQGFNVELRQFPDGWRVNFHPVGIAHSIVMGTAYEPTPARAVQRAAWQALNRRPLVGVDDGD